ncbi:hypothetical protein [Micromonospora craterilacus]|uniref:hypothetical protein n=1 Tax=Micromonospora craterilacus TaxID=1655439 RepID=UPI001314A9C0|nr:hypothetical protein [Micromonospora craterilacus]
MNADPLASADPATGALGGRRSAADESGADQPGRPSVDALTMMLRTVDAPTVVQPAVRAVDVPAVPRPAVDAPTVMMVRGDSPTTVMAAIPQLPPVFVDPSGRRRSRLRWIAYVLGLVGLLYTGLVVASFAGGPVNPETVLPFVEPTQQQWQPPPAPSQPAAEAPVARTPAAPRTTSGTRAPSTTSRSPSASAVPAAPSREPSSAPAEPRSTRAPAPGSTPSVEPPSSEPAPVTAPPAGATAGTRVDG